ncbi:MAG: aminotransferase class I/II-fold pyridoxal phosphate-dependent enzyme [Halioglobus sp.]
MTEIAMFPDYSLETTQREFYGVNEDTVARVVQEVITEEFSVVDGGVLERFEESAAQFFGAPHAVAVSNGTAALHLALFAMDLQPGDEVLIPSYAYYAVPLAVCLMGGVPVFCDVREDDLTIDLDDAERMRTDRTRAIIVHQPHGIPADAERLRSYSDHHGLRLICDAAQAHGALWDGHPLAYYYDYVFSSFGKGKLISGGELGVVTAPSDRCRDRMLLYGHVNRVPHALLTDEYRHIDNAVGVKYRPHPFALSLALEQMNTYAERSRKLVENVQIFERGLAAIPGFSPFETQPMASRMYWRFPVRVNSPDSDLAALVKCLKERNCPVHHNPGTLAHRHNVVTEYYGVKTQRAFPVAERIASEVLHVDAFPLYQDGMAERLLEAFAEVARQSC